MIHSTPTSTTSILNTCILFWTYRNQHGLNYTSSLKDLQPGNKLKSKQTKKEIITYKFSPEEVKISLDSRLESNIEYEICDLSEKERICVFGEFESE